MEQSEFIKEMKEKASDNNAKICVLKSKGKKTHCDKEGYI